MRYPEEDGSAELGNAAASVRRSSEISLGDVSHARNPSKCRTKGGKMDTQTRVWMVQGKQDFVAKLEPRFCGCFCGVRDLVT
jgi:hypothetical protein